MQYLRNEIFPAMSVNTDVSHQQFQPSDLSSWALRALRKGDTCDLTAIRKEFKLWGLLCVINYSGKVKTCERFFSCCVSKQGCHTHQWLQSPSVGWVLRALRKKCLRSSSHQDGSHSSPWAPTGPKCEKHTGYWPRIADVHIIGEASVSPDSCIFLQTEKHSISWDIWFQLIILMFRLPALCCKASI